MRTDNLLIEIGTEELPPKSLAKLALAFRDNIDAEFTDNDLSFNRVNWYASPRRLAVIVEDLSEYQADKDVEKRFRPEKGSKEYYQYLEWSHFAEGSLALPVMFSLFMGMETRSGDQKMDGYIAKEVALDFGYIESTLAKRDYFSGAEFTAADIMMQTMLEIVSKLGLLKEREKTLAYLEKIQQRSAYRKAASFG